MNLPSSHNKKPVRGEAGNEGHVSFKKFSFPLDKTSVVWDSELGRHVAKLFTETTTSL